MLWVGVLAWNMVAAAVVSAADDPAGEVESPYFEDLAGATVSGTPRLIRASPETEVFFYDLNQGYIISQGADHNPFFYAIEGAIKRREKISLRVNPSLRRILMVEGVRGARTGARPSRPVLDSATESKQLGKH